MTDREILFEFTQVGQMMRVVAIDVATDTEIVLIAPLNTARSHMERLALAKLQRRLDKPAPQTTPIGGKYA
jgi:hypothetical protein